MTVEVKPLPSTLRLNVAEAIERELGKVPPNHTVAFIATADKSPGHELRAKMAVMVNLGDSGWSFGGYLEGEVKRGLTTGAELRYSR